VLRERLGSILPTVPGRNASAFDMPGTWLRRVLVPAVIFVLIIGGALAFYSARTKNSWENKTNEVVTPNAEAVKRGDPMNVLIIGSDTRQGDDRCGAGADDTGGKRADVMMVARVDPETQQAALVSFPRDLWVTPFVDGQEKAPDRLNSAYLGGPNSLIDTLGRNFGVPINHYLEIGFDGFAAIVDAIGGVDITLAPGVDGARDTYVGLQLDGNAQKLDGCTALKWARSRHFEYRVAGTGEFQSDPTADFGRISRQQQLVRAILEQMLDNLLTDPGRFEKIIATASQDITRDSGLSVTVLSDLAKQFDELDTESVVMSQVPGTPGRSPDGTKSVVFLDADGAETYFKVLRGEAQLYSARDIGVQVINASERGDLAEFFANQFRSASYNVVGTAKASQTIETSQIRYRPDQLGKALVVNEFLRKAATLVEDPAVTADVQVIVGNDLVGAGQ